MGFGVCKKINTSGLGGNKTKTGVKVIKSQVINSIGVISGSADVRFLKRHSTNRTVVFFDINKHRKTATASLN